MGKEEVLQRSLAPGCPGTGPIPHVPGRSCEWEAASCQPPQHLQCWGGGDQAGPEEGRGAADCVLLDAPPTLAHPHTIPNAYQGPLGEKAQGAWRVRSRPRGGRRETLGELMAAG